MAATGRPGGTLPTQQTTLTQPRRGQPQPRQSRLGSSNGLEGKPTIGGLPTALPGQTQMGNQPVGVPSGTSTTENGTQVPNSAIWGQYTPEGYDLDKMQNGQDSPKYQIGRALSNFDYTQGITPEVIAALQALGLGDVMQLSKDKIQFTGNVDPRFEGYTTIDLLRGANGPGGPQAWQYGLDLPDETGGDTSGFSVPPLSSLLQGLSIQGGGGGQSGYQAQQSASQSPGPGWVRLASGDWVPSDNPLANGAKWVEQGAGTGGSSSTKPYMGDDIRATIQELLQAGGQFNSRIMDLRTEGLREDLERSRAVETDTLDAVLADRGLTGSGADIAARTNMGERIGSANATALRDLTVSESQAASDRMMQALVTGAGMTISDAQQAVDWFNAQTGREVGQGNVANAARANQIDELLGLGNLGLGQATLASNDALGRGSLGLQAQLGLGNQQIAWLEMMARILGQQSAQTPAG